MMEHEQQTQHGHTHQWVLDDSTAAEFDGEWLYVYEYCDVDGDDIIARHEHPNCEATRVTTFRLKHVERVDGTHLSSVDVNENVVLDMVSECVHEGDVADGWWEPYGGVDRDDKVVHVYACDADWYAVFQFDERNVDGGR